VRVGSPKHGHRTVPARYLVACDGAGSPIRKALGIESLRESADARARWQGAYVRLPGLLASASRTPRPCNTSGTSCPASASHTGWNRGSSR
jgi:2-polyprenyl-6-methoxyphenol hydroxylase-like FAD-dependent oxidoreductase